MKILVTGVAGFIGAACANKLLEQGYTVIGVDNLNDYYDIQLKYDRLEGLQKHAEFKFYPLDIKNAQRLYELAQKESPKRILHLAAQAGVRYSIENPQCYIDSNIIGFFNILEVARLFQVEHLVFASSSSVYGANKKLPYAISDPVDRPISLYGATKKSNELMAHSYSHLYGIPITGLRYFTVYGPWGRPDMAPIKFARKIMSGETLQVYNEGNHSRDFTFIDDITMGTLLVLNSPKHGSSQPPYKIYNIGYGQPMQLMDFIGLLEDRLGKKANKEFLPKQAGDVDHTWADTQTLMVDYGYKPEVSLQIGIQKFADWFLSYYGEYK